MKTKVWSISAQCFDYRRLSIFETSISFIEDESFVDLFEVAHYKFAPSDNRDMFVSEHLEQKFTILKGFANLKK